MLVWDGAIRGSMALIAQKMLLSTHTSTHFSDGEGCRVLSLCNLLFLQMIRMTGSIRRCIVLLSYSCIYVTGCAKEYSYQPERELQTPHGNDLSDSSYIVRFGAMHWLGRVLHQC